jgi:hypothetical protein
MQSSARRSHSAASRLPKRLRVPDVVLVPEGDAAGVAGQPGGGFAVKEFVHALLGLSNAFDGRSVPQTEDVIFAFQERLCALFEVEIESESGPPLQVFPTRLNAYLEAIVEDPAAPQAPQAPAPKPKRKTSLPIQKDSAVPVLKKKPSVVAPVASGERDGSTAAVSLPSDIVEQFNISATDVQFVFASVAEEEGLTPYSDASPRSLSVALVRADSSEDSD